MAPNLHLATTCALGACESPADQDRLALILDEYLLSLERGDAIKPEDLVDRHPEFANHLRGYLSGLMLFHRAAAHPVQLSVQNGNYGNELRGDLGDFHLIREIGRGGMGVVYEGVQVSLGRRVAVKVLPFAASVDEKQIARFRNEAQAAAQVDHPHIVPVFAIGQEHGIHYFAMQLIGGKSLSQLLAELRGDCVEGGNAAHCSGQAGGKAPQAANHVDRTIPANETPEHVNAIVQMGIQAAQALHAAHEIGVVHRDIKPSNLLLDEKGKVWVTDFGVARCKTGPNLTETGQAPGTMRYMSPEQAQGQSALVDHRTDIYSLGVTLYELAALRHPFEDVAEAAMAYEYCRSSLRPLRHWNSVISADFENIVLKAMAEGRDERYATAQELADDLERFLAAKPILARRPSLTARVGKWAKRRQRSVLAAAVVLLLAFSGTIASLLIIAAERTEKDRAYQAANANHLRAEHNYEQAQKKFRQARQMLDRFGSQVAQNLANVPGAEGIRRELLADMLPYYRDFAREEADGQELHADLALTYSKIGDLSDQLGSLSDAEQAYQDAESVLESLVRSYPHHAEYRRTLALCCNNLGQLFQKRGEMVAARAQLERALTIQQQMVVGSSQASEFRSDLATTHNNLGLLSSQIGDKQQATEHYLAAVRIQEPMLASDPNDAEVRNSLAASYNNLSSLYLSSQPEIARGWVDQAMCLQLDLVRDHPKQRAYQSDLALSYNNLGFIHARQARWADAQVCYRDAIAIQQRLVAIAPLVATHQRDLSVSYNNLGMAQSNSGALGDAEASFEKALSIQKEQVADHPQDISLLSGLGGIYNNLGTVRQKAVRLDAASTAFERAIAAQRQAHQRAPDVAYFRESLSKHYFNYAEVLRSLNRPGDAAAVAIERRKLWSGNPARLVRIAEELAGICKQIEPGELREQYINETKTTLQAAEEAGLQEMPDLKTSPFDVLISG